MDSMFPISVLTAHMYCPHKNKKQIKRNNLTCFFLNVFMYSAGSRVELSVSVMCKKKKKRTIITQIVSKVQIKYYDELDYHFSNIVKLFIMIQCILVGHLE